MTTPEILIAGHSHTAVFGLPRQDEKIELLELRPRVQGLSIRLPAPSNFVSIIAEHAIGRQLFLCWAGNHHFARFLFVDELFDFRCSDLPHIPILNDAARVPETLIEEALMPLDL